jgi:membrane associated rhomboid family serine protease
VIFPSLPRTPISNWLDIYPMTLTLTFLNLFFFYVLSDSKVDSKLFPTLSTQTQQDNYTQFVQNTARYYLEWQNLDQRPLTNDEVLVLSRSALSHRHFLTSLDQWSSQIDTVHFEKWKKDFITFKNETKNTPSRMFGLSHDSKNSSTWLTYQFIQYDASHLIMNVLSLIIFAAFVETLVGGWLVAVLYVLGGMLGGFFYLQMNPDSGLPLVGASASISALIGFAATGVLRKRIPFITIISVFGWIMRYHPNSSKWLQNIYMRPEWILVYFLIGDLIAIIATPAGWGGSVAHMAHVGGAAVGILLGLSYKWGIKRSLFSRGEPTA